MPLARHGAGTGRSLTPDRSILSRTLQGGESWSKPSTGRLASGPGIRRIHRASATARPAARLAARVCPPPASRAKRAGIGRSAWRDSGKAGPGPRPLSSPWVSCELGRKLVSRSRVGRAAATRRIGLLTASRRTPAFASSPLPGERHLVRGRKARRGPGLSQPLPMPSAECCSTRPIRLELPGEACDKFAAWSGRLLDQAAIVEQGLPGRAALLRRPKQTRWPNSRPERDTKSTTPWRRSPDASRSCCGTKPTATAGRTWRPSAAGAPHARHDRRPDALWPAAGPRAATAVAQRRRAVGHRPVRGRGPFAYRAVSSWPRRAPCSRRPIRRKCESC